MTTDLSAHFNNAQKTLFLASLLVVSLALSSFITMKRLSRFLPESGACMILGIIVGVLFIAIDQTNLETTLEFSPEMFYFILLPPIIFDAGFSMKKRNFFMNIIPILLYAVLGTIISALVFGYILYGLAVAGYLESIDSSSPIEALTFGALISATDPVATLSILGSPGTSVEPQLYSIIFGESVLNDAVGIVLFNTFSSFLGKSFERGDALAALGEFFGVSAGSVAIGLGLGLISAAFFKQGKFGKYENGHVEVAFLCLFAYSSYTIAEIAEMSGVMSLFLTGVVMQHYTLYSMSDEGKTSAHTFFKTLAIISETFVFVYLGINMSTSTVDSDFKWDGNLLVTSFTACLIARACNIIPLTLLANIGRKRKRITAKMQTLMWFAGLRGAVAFSLALNVDSDNKKYIITTTLFIAISTTLVFGCLTAPLVKALGLVQTESLEESMATTKYMDGSTTGSIQNLSAYEKEKQFLNGNAGGQQKEFGKVHTLWRKFDEKLMKSIFGGRPRDYQELH